MKVKLLLATILVAATPLAGAAQLTANALAAYNLKALQTNIGARRTSTISSRVKVTSTLVFPHADGARMVFDGGLQGCLRFDHEWIDPAGMGGQAAALEWVGAPGGGPMLDVRGGGLSIEGGANLIGYTQPAGPWKPLDHARDLASLAILIRGVGGGSGVGLGVDTGAVHTGPLFIGGFRRGIQFGSGLTENNADNCYFSYIACSHVDNLVCFKNRQAVSNNFGKIRQFADGTPAEQRAFELLRFEAGGKCHVDHAEINAGLVCRAIRSDWNTGFCRINALSTDPAGGHAFRLFDGAPELGSEPCPFHFTIGELWNGIAERESSGSAGYLVDAYAGQRVNIEGGGLIEATNGPSIRLRGTKTLRAVMAFRGVTFESQSTPRELLAPGSKNYTLVCTDCFDREGNVFSGTLSDK